jgi:hypothetical protein
MPEISHVRTGHFPLYTSFGLYLDMEKGRERRFVTYHGQPWEDSILSSVVFGI